MITYVVTNNDIIVLVDTTIPDNTAGGVVIDIPKEELDKIVPGKSKLIGENVINPNRYYLELSNNVIVGYSTEEQDAFNTPVYLFYDEIAHLKLGYSQYVYGEVTSPTDTEYQAHLNELRNTPESLQWKYEAYVEQLIRKKYTVSQELAILRQRDTKPEEFTVYNTYAEECKAQAKKEFNISEEVVNENGN